MSAVRCRWWLVLLAFALHAGANAQFVHTKDARIVDAKGHPLLIVGPNLGNWLVFEGYMLGIDVQGWSTPTGFELGVKYALDGDEQRALRFVERWRESYVDRNTLRQIRSQGFNSVRVPFSYRLFWDGKQLTDAGFRHFDRIIAYCRDLGMHVQFDMHAAPGYQNPGHHSDNPNEEVRESVRFWADWSNVELAARIWQHVARRYASEPVIWSWDLLNEPVTRNDADKARLEESYRVIAAAIRSVDRNHLISIQGDWWGSDFSPLTSKWDDKLVFQTHHYPQQNELQAHDTMRGGLGDRLRHAQKLGVPLWLGEFGENSYPVLRGIADWSLANGVGYAPWSFKRIETDRALWSIRKTDGYQRVIDYLKSATYPNKPTSKPPAEAFEALIDFADAVRNDSRNVTAVPGYLDAVRPGTTAATTAPAPIQ